MMMPRGFLALTPLHVDLQSSPLVIRAEDICDVGVNKSRVFVGLRRGHTFDVQESQAEVLKKLTVAMETIHD